MSAADKDDYVKCGARAVGGPCILPRGHNIGHADVPENHSAVRWAGKMLGWMKRHGFTQEAFERCPAWVQICVWIVTTEIIVLILWATVRTMSW